MATPQIRATWAKFTIGSIKRMPAPQRSALVASVGEELRDEIRRGHSLGWHDARVFSELCGRIAACGRSVALDFWRQSLRASIEKPLINVLVQGGLAFVGHSPAALYARTPRAWKLVSRDCGTMHYDQGPDGCSGTLSIAGLPRVCRDHRGLLLMWEGGALGQAAYVGHTLEVDVEADPSFELTGGARFRLRWAKGSALL